MSDDDPLNSSIQSLKHLSMESKQNAPCSTFPDQPMNTSAFGSQTQIAVITESDWTQPPMYTNVASSCASIAAINNRCTMTEIAFLDPAGSNIPLDEDSVGGKFLRQMCEDAKPIKTYTSYLRKDSVNLYDECDAAIVLQLVQKEKKSKAECDFLLKAIRNLHIFQKNKDMLQMKDCSEKIFSSLKIEHFPAKKAIFNYGEFGYTYYIVLSGEADLLIPAPVHVPEKKEETPKSNNDMAGVVHETIKKKKGLNLNSKWTMLKKSFVPDQEDMDNMIAEQKAGQNAVLDFVLEDETQEDFLKRQYPHMNLIKTFKAGEAFGEIALMTKQRRTGTVVCRKGTNLMTLNKESFDLIMGSYSENILLKKLNFLKSYNFFRSMPDSKLMSLLNFMKIVHYRNKNIVYTENDPSRFIYFIRDGEVQISQVCTIEDPLERQKAKASSMASIEEAEESSHHEINAVRQRKAKKSKTKRIPLVIKSDHSYFGEEEILKHIDTRKQQAICMSETAEIFLLKKDILYNYTRGYSVVEKMKEEFKIKGEWNQRRKEDILNTRQSTNLSIDKNMSSLVGKRNSASKPTASPSIAMKEQQQFGGAYQIKDVSPFSLAVQPTTSMKVIPSPNQNQVIAGKQRLSLQENRVLTESTSLSAFEQQQQNLRQRKLSNILGKIENTSNQNVSQIYQQSQFNEGLTWKDDTLSQQNIKAKLSPENKVVLKLNSNNINRRLLFPDENAAPSSGIVPLKESISQWKQSSSSSSSSIAEEESYIENKLQKNNQRRKTEAVQRSEQELRKAAITQFGQFSYSAFVHQVEQNVEHKAQVLKQLQSNSHQSPSWTTLGDLYEDFGLKKKQPQMRSSNIFAGLSIPVPLAKKDSNQNFNNTLRTHSGARSTQSGKEFQQEILKQQRNSVKNLFKKKVFSFSSSTSSTSTANANTTTALAIDESVTSSVSRKLIPTHKLSTLSRDSSLTSVLESDRLRTLEDRSASIIIEGYQQSNRSRTSILEYGGMQECKVIQAKPTTSLAYINDLDILEEVSESNSPIKNRRFLAQQQECDRISIPPPPSQHPISQYQLIDRRSFVSPTPNTIASDAYKGVSELSYSCKAFFNRSTNNLRKKAEAKRALSRNASQNGKENNSFRISSIKSQSALPAHSKHAPAVAASSPITTSSFFFPIKIDQ